MKNNLCALLTLLSLSAPALADCLKEGDSVTLSGTLVRSSFAADLDIARAETGEHNEGYWFLKSTQPIGCVDGVDTGWHDWDHKFQLVLSGEDYDQYRPLLGRRVNVTGKIMLAVSAHHKTAILIEKESVQAENEEKVTRKVILH